MNDDKKNEEEIFKSAIEIDSPQKRDAFIKSVCGEDAELLRRVEGLLKFHYDDDRFLVSPPTCEDITLDTSPLTEVPGTKIGRYKLLQLIGEGGFGVVYMAEQEKPIRRRVALKIIKLGMDTKQVIARFEAERQALAMMEHPNIAKVFDGGATDTGRPYFVMELVKGMPITEYCDQNNLHTQQRLELFVDVCKAVQHAHQKGIIHRDIKPSNVMITLHDGKPVPKVIDFGIAKATAHRLTEKTLFTEYQQFIGTPEYMSPEQAEMSGLDVDTRSDIYSMGVLLYELLTGTTPFEAEKLRSAAYDEIRRIIREDEPPKPSTRLSTLGETLSEIAMHRHVQPGELRRIVRGDLDWIVMKSLEKDRTRRYETANELAQDIQRHLADEPVVAGPPSAVYLLRKFIRRNRPLVTSVAVVFVVLMIGIVVSTIFAVGQARARKEADTARDIAEALRKKETAARIEAVTARNQAQQAEKHAEANFQRAQEAINEMTEAARDLFVNRSQTVQVQRKLLQRAQVFYEGFLEDNRNNPAFRLDIGHSYRCLGDTHQALGQSEQAVSAYEQSILVLEELAADFENEAEYKRQIAISNNYMGVALCSLGRFEEALAVYERAAGLLEELMAEFGTEPDYLIPLSWVYRHRGIVLQRIGEIEEAEKIFRRTLAISQKLVDKQPAEPDYRRGLAIILESLGRLIGSKGRYEEAEQLVQRAVDISEKLAAEFSEEISHRYDLAARQTLLGDLLWRSGRKSDAVDVYRKSLGICKELTKESPVEPVYKWQKAYSWGSLGKVLRAMGDLKEAENAYNEAIGILEKLAADYPEVPGYQNVLSRNHIQLGNILFETGRSEEATFAFGKVIELHPNNQDAWFARATAYSNVKQWDKAVVDFSKVIELDPNNANASYRRALAHLGMGDTEKYRQSCNQFLEYFEETEDPAVCHWVALSCVLAPDAVEDFSRVIELAQFATESSNETDHTRNVLGAILYRAGKFNEALKQLSSLADEWEQGKEFPTLTSPAYTWFFLAMIHHRLGNADESQHYLKLANERAAEEIAGDAPWNRKLTLQLLRKEAAQLLGITQAAPPKATDTQ